MYHPSCHLNQHTIPNGLASLALWKVQIKYHLVRNLSSVDGRAWMPFDAFRRVLTRQSATGILNPQVRLGDLSCTCSLPHGHPKGCSVESLSAFARTTSCSQASADAQTPLPGANAPYQGVHCSHLPMRVDISPLVREAKRKGRAMLGKESEVSAGTVDLCVHLRWNRNRSTTTEGSDQCCTIIHRIYPGAAAAPGILPPIFQGCFPLRRPAACGAQAVKAVTASTQTAAKRTNFAKDGGSTANARLGMLWRHQRALYT